MGKNTIQLKSLECRYFKSFRNLKVEFKDGVTVIKGDNGTGKTTLFDAFSWLFFGKDSNDSSDTKFSIKTIDEKTGEIISRVDHIVEAVFLINGERTTAKRELKEKWTKKKGALKKVYTGNSTNYYWNEVPLTQREYNEKINEFINEDIFKLTTDPYKFNSLQWEKQRDILIDLNGAVSDHVIAKGNENFESLMSKLNNKSFNDYKKQMKNTLKKLKDDKHSIPARIDEQLRDRPEEQDFDVIEAEIRSKNLELKKLDDKISDKNKLAEEIHKKYDALREEKSTLKSANYNIEFETEKEVSKKIESIKNPADEITKQLREVESGVEEYNDAIERLNSTLKTDEISLSNVFEKMKVLSDKWDNVNSKELKFNEGDFNCPACNRPLEAKDQESEKQKMIVEFNKNKQKELQEINKEGISLKENKAKLEGIIAKTKERINNGKKLLREKVSKFNSLKEKLDEVKSNATFRPEKEEEIKKLLSSNKEYQKNISRITEIEKELEVPNSVDVYSLKAERQSILDEIDVLKLKLNDKFVIERIDKRVSELEKEEEENAQLVADAERELYIIQEFEVARMTTIEKSVNSKFKHVTFRMFNELVDGTQVPACICLYKGVPFPDVNTAGKIKAGLDIINALCEYYQVFCPIFIDGAESITEIPDTESQQIRLAVEKGVVPFIIK